MAVAYTPSSRKKNTYTVHADKQGLHYHHPQKGQVEVVALFCNCGRSILVAPNELKQEPILCGRCESPFGWQQLRLKI